MSQMAQRGAFVPFAEARARNGVERTRMNPLKTLTAALGDTYTICNPRFRYQTGAPKRKVLSIPSAPAGNEGHDNKNGDLIIAQNDELVASGMPHGFDGAYRVMEMLGQGTFGQVVKCLHLDSNRMVAVKVIKNREAYTKQARVEINVVQLLNEIYDPDGSKHTVRFFGTFAHLNHQCIVFELLSVNLYELLKQNNYAGLSWTLIRTFMKQLLESIACLSTANILHCDLKPENILLENLKSPDIKLIDFGSACFESQSIHTYIQSRFYRSPEILLGVEWHSKIDMWSIGCIAAEMFLGLPLFPGANEYDQVRRIAEYMGPLDQQLLRQGSRVSRFFKLRDKAYVFKSDIEYISEHRLPRYKSKRYFRGRDLEEVILFYRSPRAKSHDSPKERKKRLCFLDFLQGCLCVDPFDRWSPHDALQHPFLTGASFSEPFTPRSSEEPASTSPQDIPVAYKHTAEIPHLASPSDFVSKPRSYTNRSGKGMTFVAQTQFNVGDGTPFYDIGATSRSAKNLFSSPHAVSYSYSHGRQGPIRNYRTRSSFDKSFSDVGIAAMSDFQKQPVQKATSTASTLSKLVRHNLTDSSRDLVSGDDLRKELEEKGDVPPARIRDNQAKYDLDMLYQLYDTADVGSPYSRSLWNASGNANQKAWGKDAD